MSEIVLINISGKDRKGINCRFTSILAQYNVNILDIGQSVIHENILLGILVEIPVESDFPYIFKDILFEGYKLSLHIDIESVQREHYQKWVGAQGKERRIITLLGKKLTAHQIASVTSVIAANNLNIDSISRLTGRISLDKNMNYSYGNVDRNDREVQQLNQIKACCDGDRGVYAPARACIQLSVSGTPSSIKSMRGDFMKISQETGIDISFHIDNIYSKNRKLVVFDMDSTLIQAEVINELAKIAGVGEKVSAITESAMRGEIDFKESFRKRVSLLKGLKASQLENLAHTLPLSEGVELVSRTLKELGYKLGILSGGFTFVGNYLKEKLHFDYIYANELEVADGEVTGEVTGEIIDGERKAQLLREIARKENISIEQTIAVGDGANDLPMITIAGLGVAYNAKPLVREKAASNISNVGLDGLLYLIGMRDREINKEYRNRGFTLIELMVVVVILGILASLIVPKLMGRTDEARVVKAKVDISAIETGLKLYRLDNGNYPTTEQGLLALIEEPGTEPLPRKWHKGGYLDREQIPKDPWDREYIYLSPGVHNEYDIISYGADGAPGGEANDADVKSWELE